MSRLVCALFTLLVTCGHVSAINVVWINDGWNTVGNATVQMVMDNVGAIGAGAITIDNSAIIQTSEDHVATMNNICARFDEMRSAGLKPDLVLDTTTAGDTSVMVKSLMYSLGVPTIAASYGTLDDLGEWSSLNGDQSQYLVHIKPPTDNLVQVLRAVISSQNISNAAILYEDSSYVMEYKYGTLLQNVPVRHLINRMKSTKEEIEKQVSRMDELDLNNLFLLGSPEMISHYLAAANKLRVYGYKYAWFAMSKHSLNDLQCDCDELDVVTMVPKSLTDDKVATLRRSFGLEATPDLDVAFYYDVAVKALRATGGLSEAWASVELPSCQELIDSEETAPIISRQGLDLRGNFAQESEPTTYGPLMTNGHSEGSMFMEFGVSLQKHMYKQSKLVKRENVGEWRSSSEENLAFTGVGLEKFAADVVYMVAVVVQPPFINKETDAEGNVVFTGYCVDLINEMAQLLDFQYELYETPDNQYGRMSPDGSWNGAVKELVDKRADVALGAMSVMAERETVVDFTVPYYDLVGLSILMKKAKVPTSLFKFLSVLEASVWGCIVLAYFITSALLWVFDKYSPYSYQNNMEKYHDDPEKRYFDLKECLWFCMTSLTPQGGGEAPKNLSGRFVVATWWLFGFIIIASYTANLAAFLTVSRLETPVESLEDLSRQYKIQFSPVNASSAAIYFERMAYIEDQFYEIWKDMSLDETKSDYERSKLAVWDYPVSDKYTKIWQSMRESLLPENFEDALVRVRKSPSSSEGYAMLGDATDIRYQVLTNCDLLMVGEEFSRKPYAVAVQQGSPLKDQFNDAILKLLNQRKLETLKERWWNQNPNKKVCDDSDDDNTGGISIYNIGGVFIVIFVGIGLAIVTLIFEYWYYKIYKPQSRVDSTDKRLQVKQAMASNFNNERTGYDTEYRSTGKDIAPLGNPW